MPGTFGYLAGVRGELTRQSFTAPGAGTNFFVSVPATELWQMVMVHVRFTTNATVATRTNRIHFDPATAGTVNPVIVFPYNQTASQVTETSLLSGSARNDAAPVALGGSLYSTIGLGDWMIWDGLFRITCTNIQAGDQFNIIEATYWRWRV